MREDRSRFTTVFAVSMLVAAMAACGADPAPPDPSASAFEAVSTHETTAVKWEDSWDSAFTRAASEGKPVLVSFEAEWCVWCKKLDSTTYRDSKVRELFARELIPLTLDVDDEGEALSSQYAVESLPTVLVFDPDGHERGRINGYLPPDNFVEAVSDILKEG